MGVGPVGYLLRGSRPGLPGHILGLCHIVSPGRRAGPHWNEGQGPKGRKERVTFAGFVVGLEGEGFWFL